MNYPMYNNNNQFYMQDLQNMRDRIDQQMRQIQQNNIQQPQTPTTVNQTFQISPQNQNTDNLESKIVKDIDEVKNTLVMKTGVFVTDDYSTIWIKDVTGNIRTFNTTEVIELDEKDKKIIALQNEIEELKGVVLNAKSNVKYDDANVTDKKSTNVQYDKSSKK